MIVAVIHTLLSSYILDNYLAKQYERIVLRPEITDTEIKEAYLLCVRDIHAQTDQFGKFCIGYVCVSGGKGRSR